MCDPSKGPGLNILVCGGCGEENEAFTDEDRISCEGCGKEIINPNFHVHEPVKCRL
jgi:ribosomal protein S27E